MVCFVCPTVYSFQCQENEGQCYHWMILLAESFVNQVTKAKSLYMLDCYFFFCLLRDSHFVSLHSNPNFASYHGNSFWSQYHSNVPSNDKAWICSRFHLSINHTGEFWGKEGEREGESQRTVAQMWAYDFRVARCVQGDKLFSLLLIVMKYKSRHRLLSKSIVGKCLLLNFKPKDYPGCVQILRKNPRMFRLKMWC